MARSRIPEVEIRIDLNPSMKAIPMKKYLLIISNTVSDIVEALTTESNNYAVDSEAMLIPYGDHPHKNGVQRFTKEHAEVMVSNFNSLLGKLGRLFGGLPVYIGHPDDPAFSNQHTDAKSYAWIMGMEARDNGLALIPKWSKPGEEIISNAHYKWFSPRWACKEIGRENGKAILAPLRLISVGLTNMPQIGGIPPLANEEPLAVTEPAEQTQEEPMPLLKRLFAILGLAETATAEDLVIKITAMQSAIVKMKASIESRWSAENAATQALANASVEDQLAQVFAVADEALAHANQAITVVNGDLEYTRNALLAERASRRELIVSNAISAGIITPADKDKWLAALSENFDGKSVELSNMKPILHIAPVTTNLGARKTEIQTTRDKVLTLVNTRMSEKGEDYETAFASVRKEHAALFDTMKQPAK